MAALRIEIGKLDVLPACTGCGACAAVCPTGALRAPPPADTVLADRALRNTPPAFVCSRATAGPGEVPVPCLARVSSAVMMRLCRNRTKRLTLIEGDCDRCPNGRARSEAVRRSRAALEDVCRAVGLSPLAITFEKRPASRPRAASAFSRRELFEALLGSRAIDMGTAQTLRGEMRAAHASTRKSSFSRAPIGVPEFAGECDACGLCARFCPSGALRTEEEDGAFRLVRAADACVACGTCESVCARDALRVHRGVRADGDVSAAGAATLVETRLTACRVCGAAVAGAADLCVGCARRSEVPAVPWA